MKRILFGLAVLALAPSAFAQLLVKKGTTDVTAYIVLVDSTTGAPETAITITNLDLQYVRYRVAPSVKADATALAATNSAHTDNACIEIDATDQPGLYRCDFPDAAFATGAPSVVVTVVATGVHPAHLEYQLVDFDPQDTVRLGLTALPNAAAEAAGGLYTRGTGVGQINQPANGQIDTNTVAMATGVVTATAIATDAIGADEVAAGAIGPAEIATGAIDADAVAADAVTEIRSVVSGTSDSGSTTSMVDAARTEADTDYWKDMAILFTSGTIAGQARLITAFAPATDTMTFSPAVTQAVATQTYEIIPNVAAAGASAPTAAQVADAVWDEASADHVAAGSTGERVERLDIIASGGAGGLTNARAVLIDNLDAPVTSRLAPTTAGRTLDVTATGEAGLDLDNTAGGLAKGTEITGFNDLSAAQVNAEMDQALIDVRLDELLAADSDIDGLAPPAVGSVFHEALTKTAGSFTFDQTTDSPEAIRDNMGTPQTGDSFARLGAPAGASVSADLAAIEAQTDDIGAAGAGLTAIPSTDVVKNAVLSDFEFLMVDSLDHITPKTGLTVTGQRSCDGAAFTGVSGAIAEVGSGVYQFDAAAADTNCAIATWKFNATGADTFYFTFRTRP